MEIKSIALNKIKSYNSILPPSMKTKDIWVIGWAIMTGKTMRCYHQSMKSSTRTILTNNSNNKRRPCWVMPRVTCPPSMTIICFATLMVISMILQLPITMMRRRRR